MGIKSRIAFRFTTVVLGAFIMTSCVSYYRQVSVLESDNVELNGSDFVYQTPELDIYYNFWADGGRVAFMVVNKTDSTIIFDKTKSFLINNGLANEYYENAAYTNSRSSYNSSTYYSSTTAGTAYANASASASASSYSNTGYASARATVNAYENENSVKKQQSDTKSYSKTIYEKEKIQIPAHSSIWIDKFGISYKTYRECGLARNPKPDELMVKTFEEGKNYIVLENRLTFIINGEEKNVVNNFRVAKVGNMSRYTAIYYANVKVCDYGYASVKKERFRRPNSFYIDYQISSGSSSSTVNGSQTVNQSVYINNYSDRTKDSDKYNVLKNNKNQDDAFKE